MVNNVIASIMTVAIVASVIGASYAYFSDTELSLGNTFAAGILDLSINGQNNFSGSVVKITDMKPSYDKYSDPIYLSIQENPGRLFKKITNVQCFGGALTGPESLEQNGAERDDIDSVTWFDMKICGVQTIHDRQVSLKDIENKWIYIGLYQPGVQVGVVQSFHMFTNTTNWAQGDYCTFDEVFAVLQNNTQGAPSGDCFNNCSVCLTSASVSTMSVQQGKEKNGNAVPAIRSVPANALYLETTHTASDFFSLGFGGNITLFYNYPIINVNGSGADIKVVEDTWGSYPLEKANVYASQDGLNWTLLGTADNTHRDTPSSDHTTASFDLILPWAQYIRITDVSDPAVFPDPTSDGYDLNAVIALQDCSVPIICPTLL